MSIISIAENITQTCHLSEFIVNELLSDVREAGIAFRAQDRFGISEFRFTIPYFLPGIFYR